MTGTGALCVLGFDVGSRRIGVAVGNTISMSARALEVVNADGRGPDWERISRLIRDWTPARLVVGEPLTLEGEAQAATRRARAFAQEAHQRFALPVDLIDERSSSKEASHRFAARRAGGSARRIDAERLDSVAAEIIVERWLREQPIPPAS
jgi:putative Holliday junction resolvase